MSSDKDSLERDIVERALNGKPRSKRFKSGRYSTLDNIVDLVVFNYPTACYVQIVDLDDCDAAGFPKVTVRQIKQPAITQTSTNSYSSLGRLIGAEVRDVFFKYTIVTVVAKQGAARMKCQKIEGHSNRAG